MKQCTFPLVFNYPPVKLKFELCKGDISSHDNNRRG